jgi:hypothetical protein
MPAVLLRLARLDAFGKDAELNPPHAQLREPAYGLARERRAVVRADGARQAELAKRELELLPNGRVTRLNEPLALDQVPTRRVGNREGVTARAVAECEMALEVGTPNVVGFHGVRQRLRTRRYAQTTTSRPHLTVAVQDVSNRACCGHHALVAGLHQEHGTYLLRPVERMLLPERQDLVHDHVRRLVRAHQRDRFLVFEACWPKRVVAREPLISLRSADAELLAEPLEVPSRVILHGCDESNSLIHGTDLLPRHGQPPFAAQRAVPAICEPTNWLNMCNRSSRSRVSPKLPV